MKFSAHLETRIGDWKLIPELEQLGYDAVWVPDTQMMWSDCYAVMALGAANTSTIRIGTGIAVPGTRIAPTTAMSIASINVLAPGRTFLGIGTGHTAMRVMGHDPMGIREFREYLRVVRAMLDDEEVEFTWRDKTTRLRWQDHGAGFRNVEDRIPMYVAANGPLALKTAGAIGDGIVSLFNEDPEMLTSHLAQARAGADKAGRTFPADFHTTALTHAVVLRPGEKLSDERIQRLAAPWTAVAIHFVYEIWRYTGNDDVVPAYMKNIWEEYTDQTSHRDVGEERLHQVLHTGHCSFCPEDEIRFATPEVIEGCTLCGEPEQIAAQIRECADLGLNEVSLLPGLHEFREVVTDFAERVIPLV
ncbi:MAG: LLM class flavin-dependent oxidoreductase [Gammaproteobacteria bacterium]